MNPHRGGVILALGIIGLVVCHPLGIAAWIMGKNDLAEMDRGYMDSSGRDLTKAGQILGIVATALMIFQLVIVFIYLCFIALFAIASH
jgi:hypothetical protein